MMGVSYPNLPPCGAVIVPSTVSKSASDAYEFEINVPGGHYYLIFLNPNTEPVYLLASGDTVHQIVFTEIRRHTLNVTQEIPFITQTVSIIHFSPGLGVLFFPGLGLLLSAIALSSFRAAAIAKTLTRSLTKVVLSTQLLFAASVSVTTLYEYWSPTFHDPVRLLKGIFEALFASSLCWFTAHHAREFEVLVALASGTKIQEGPRRRQLPFWFFPFILALFSVVSVWILIREQPQYAILVSISLAILIVFEQRYSRWRQSRKSSGTGDGEQRKEKNLPP